LNTECSLQHFRAMQFLNNYIDLSKILIIPKLTSCALGMYGHSVTFA
jgi:hypothetical protein